MSALIRGPHHCVGIATAVAARIFGYLKARAEVQGGVLSPADLEALHTQFLASLSNSASYFETIDRQYMVAAGATAADMLSRDNILATLIFAVSHTAARMAFPQAERFGGQWLDEFCSGIAQHVRLRICADADNRLLKAYFDLAGRLGAKLVVKNLLSDDAVLSVLRECLMPLINKGAAAAVCERFCDDVNGYIAAQRHIVTPDPAKITQAEARKFLVFLRSQSATFLGAEVAA